MKRFQMDVVDDSFDGGETPIEGDVLQQINYRSKRAVGLAKEALDKTDILSRVVNDNANEARVAHKHLNDKLDQLDDKIGAHLGDLREFTGKLSGQLEWLAKSESVTDKVKFVAEAEANKARAQELTAFEEHRRKVRIQLIAALGAVVAALVTAGVTLIIHFS